MVSLNEIEIVVPVGDTNASASAVSLAKKEISTMSWALQESKLANLIWQLENALSEAESLEIPTVGWYQIEEAAEVAKQVLDGTCTEGHLHTFCGKGWVQLMFQWRNPWTDFQFVPH